MRRRGTVRKRRYGAGAGADADGIDSDGAPASRTSRTRGAGSLSRTAWRRKPLPNDWLGPDGIRQRVLERDGRKCQIRLADRCVVDASAVDHIDPDGPERMDNYQAVCVECHRWKTGVEGAKGKAQKAAARRAERHPGYL